MKSRVGVESGEVDGACLERDAADGARNHCASWLDIGHTCIEFVCCKERSRIEQPHSAVQLY